LSRLTSNTILTAPETVVGYHGCSLSIAKKIISAQRFLPSTMTYDWLGEGIYFWEYAPYRALEWAEQKRSGSKQEPAVLFATIRLGRCLNLLDTEHIPGLAATHAAFVETVNSDRLPKNTEKGAHYLDRKVINAYCRTVARGNRLPFQTVRGTFAEGEPIYPGSKIFTKAHTQIAVRDHICILDIHLVEFP
jgi:hypothetical protein